MALVVSGTTISVGGTALPADQFPVWAQRHLNRVSGTLALEARGKHLRESDFADEAELADFIRAVCRWGGYAGIGGRIIRGNSPSCLREHFQLAAKCLDGGEPSVLAAMRSLAPVKGLGRVSFASKHLRFLRPDLCPVFDRLLASWVGVTLNWGTYAGFTGDCSEIARVLDVLGVLPPEALPERRWRPADVEMAMFAFVRSLSN